MKKLQSNKKMGELLKKFSHCIKNKMNKLKIYINLQFLSQKLCNF